MLQPGWTTQLNQWLLVKVKIFVLWDTQACFSLWENCCWGLPTEIWGQAETPTWKSSVSQSSPHCAAARCVRRTRAFGMSSVVLKFQKLQKLKAEHHSAFRKKPLSSLLLMLPTLKDNAAVPAQRVKKANSGSMQTPNTLNPTVYFVSKAERGAFALWLGDLTSTNSKGWEEQGWLPWVQKYSLRLQYKYLKAILNNLFSPRKTVTSSHPRCQNFNPYQMEITICPLDQWLALGSHWFSYYGKDIIWDTW